MLIRVLTQYLKGGVLVSARGDSPRTLGLIPPAFLAPDSPELPSQIGSLGPSFGERDSLERDSLERDCLERDYLERDSLERDSLERESLERESLERESLEREALEGGSLEREMS